MRPTLASSLALVGYALAREDFIWDCASGAGSIQSCNNACFAVNCVPDFAQTTTFFMARYMEAQNRIDSGQSLSPDPCNDGWTGDDRWRVAGDRTAGGLAATDMDEFPFAATSNGGSGARLRCVNPSDNRSGGAKFGTFLTRVGWDDPTDDSNGAVDRSFSIMIENYGDANYCGLSNIDCTNDGAEFHLQDQASSTFVDGKRDVSAKWELDDTPAAPSYRMRRFMGSDGKERLLLGRDNGTLPFEVGRSSPKKFQRENGERFNLMYEIMY